MLALVAGGDGEKNSSHLPCRSKSVFFVFIVCWLRLIMQHGTRLAGKSNMHGFHELSAIAIKLSIVIVSFVSPERYQM